VLDIRMPAKDGLQTAQEIHRKTGGLPIIFYTGYPGDYEESQVERKHRPFDYVVKGESPERLRRSVSNAVTQQRLRFDAGRLAALAGHEYGMIGSSAAMLGVYRAIEQIAPTEVKVLILGESGTGKELVARAVHRRSRRSTRKYAAYDCSHRNPDIVEAELFGTRSGAYTGARDTTGLIEVLNGGTLFLDEVGDLADRTQSRLLRFVQEGTFSRVGEHAERRSDIRLITATSRDLEGMIATGAFRREFYYRFAQTTIRLAPLRERREDIPLLIHHFVDTTCESLEHGPRLLTDGAMDLLISHDWPGNVRQLENAIRTLLSSSSSSLITADEIASHLRLDATAQPDLGAYQKDLLEWKRTYFLKALARCNGNISETAHLTGLDASNLRRMLRSLGLEAGQCDPGNGAESKSF
jgi:DNA-binding NtrC family response regulator